ncbi:MAG: maleylpyruvate isomerase family mycothiol-dependent enzyme [Streptosporangiaceae bacterium]
MIGSIVVASRLPQTDRDQAALIGEAEGRASLHLLRQLGGRDWQRPTDCTEWDVRALISHLVAQCEDGVGLRTMLRREMAGRRRYPDKTGVDAHMAAQVDDHRSETGPELVERFALLWPRAVRARRRRPGALRRITIASGVPACPRFSIGYLVDVIYNRDLWMHRLDLARATRRPFAIGDHDRHIVEQVVRDLAVGWTAAPIALELTGSAGGSWLIGSGEPVASVRADAVACMCQLAGRASDAAVELVSGDETAFAVIRGARVVF